MICRVFRSELDEWLSWNKETLLSKISIRENSRRGDMQKCTTNTTPNPSLTTSLLSTNNPTVNDNNNRGVRWWQLLHRVTLGSNRSSLTCALLSWRIAWLEASEITDQTRKINKDERRTRKQTWLARGQIWGIIYIYKTHTVGTGMWREITLLSRPPPSRGCCFTPEVPD